MDDELTIRQWNQPPIGLTTAPFQHLPMLVRQMCTRNRTRSEEGCRQETEELMEIDRAATQANTKTLNEEDRLVWDFVSATEC